MDKKKRLFYERPQLEVVELEVTASLLVESEGKSGKGGQGSEDFSPAYFDLDSDDND